MDEQILTQLRVGNPAERREGVRQAAESGDPAYIKALWAIHDGDPSQEMRDLAQNAVAQIRRGQKARAAAEAGKSASPPTERPSSLLRPPAGGRASGPSRSPSAVLPVLIVGALFIGLVGVVVWAVINAVSTPIQQAASTIDFISRLANPRQFPVAEGSSAPDRLTGEFWVGTTIPYSSFYVLEPTGETPPGGWSMLLVLHDWLTDGLVMMQPYAQRAAEEGVILVAASWDHRMTMMTYEGDWFYTEDLFEMLGTVWTYYPLHERAQVVSGFGWGANLASSISASYPDAFPGVVLGGADQYSQPPRGSTTHYAVIIGEDDTSEGTNRPQQALDFVLAMRTQEMPVWSAEIIPGLGHEMPALQIDKAFELLRLLRTGGP
ncbi:MAG: hypothetical protein L6Q98_12700 [Anaerolineae bacterium]|nr:hypothetical protein [Anaerolineae bacterium]NUQ06977.1 hypothetical protein [Anaerolineae bacterium]